MSQEKIKGTSKKKWTYRPEKHFKKELKAMKNFDKEFKIILESEVNKRQNYRLNPTPFYYYY